MTEIKVTNCIIHAFNDTYFIQENGDYQGISIFDANREKMDAARLPNAALREILLQYRLAKKEQH